MKEGILNGITINFSELPKIKIKPTHTEYDDFSFTIDRRNYHEIRNGFSNIKENLVLLIKNVQVVFYDSILVSSNFPNNRSDIVEVTIHVNYIEWNFLEVNCENFYLSSFIKLVSN